MTVLYKEVEEIALLRLITADPGERKDHTATTVKVRPLSEWENYFLFRIRQAYIGFGLYPMPSKRVEHATSVLI